MYAMELLTTHSCQQVIQHALREKDTVLRMVSAPLAANDRTPDESSLTMTKER